MIKHSLLPFVCLLLTILCAPLSIQAAKPTSEFLLWTGWAPGATGNDYADQPTLTPYYAATSNATGAAMIVCPGGAYGWLANPSEGADYALWLNDRGISAFVLKYRLGSDGYHHPVEMWDAQRAIRYVRANAMDWDLDPNRIGIMGSSAGGHLASTAMVHFDDGDPGSLDPIEHASCRPDIGVLCYPVITMQDPYTHAVSRDYLMGAEVTNTILVEYLSSELQVTTNTPPAFLFHNITDGSVPYQNSTMFSAALETNGVPHELHLYPSGGHGGGLGTTPGDVKNYLPWVHECAHWLYQIGFGLPHLGNIWPLGDSITQGSAVPALIPGGYRNPLYTNLTARGYTFTFVGSRTINPSPTLTGAGQQHHDGWSGYTIKDISGYSGTGKGLYDMLDTWMPTNTPPDLILLLIGINDINHDYDIATAPDRLDELLTRLFNFYPDTRILISTLTEAEGDNAFRGGATNDLSASISDYNAAMATMVAERRDLDQDIVLVDMHAGLMLSDLEDKLHPSAEGYEKMGNIWADAIVADPPNFTTNGITSTSGMVEMEATGALCTSYSLWSSENLTNSTWTLMGYGNITTHPFTVTDAPTNTQQYYRFSAP